MIEFLLILGAMVIYFTPALVAAWVRHPKLAYIGGVNAALGMTVVGWAGALMWALRRRKVIARSYHGDMEVPRSFNVSLLAMCGLVVGVAVVANIAVNRLQFRNSSPSTAPIYVASATTPSQPQWNYTEANGVRTASLPSTNSVAQPAPFKGGPVTLSVVHGADGPVVKLDADSELACSYAPTASSVEISFDNGPGQTFACAPAPAGARKLLFDGDHSTAYLADPVAFLSRLRGVRHISVVSSFANVTEPQSLEYDLPAGDPMAVAAAPIKTAPVPVASGEVASAVAAVAVPAAAVADDDSDHGHRRHHHRRHARRDDTYVDGVPAHGSHRHHHRRG